VLICREKIYQKLNFLNLQFFNGLLVGQTPFLNLEIGLEPNEVLTDSETLPMIGPGWKGNQITFR
jgi:hypothetical protein